MDGSEASDVGASFFFFQAEDGIRDRDVTGVQTCALPICWFDPAMQAVAGTGDDAVFLIFRTVLAFDHARQQIQIRTLAEVEPGAGETELKRRYDAAAAKNRE